MPLDNIAKRAEAYKSKERIIYKMIKEYIEAIKDALKYFEVWNKREEKENEIKNI